MSKPTHKDVARWMLFMALCIAVLFLQYKLRDYMTKCQAYVSEDSAIYVQGNNCNYKITIK